MTNYIINPQKKQGNILIPKTYADKGAQIANGTVIYESKSIFNVPNIVSTLAERWGNEQILLISSLNPTLLSNLEI